ncbi:MAG: Dyp-type peroxidase [Bacteroidota bacterium]
MENIERENIQGMLLYGYKWLPVARYLFLSITDVDKARSWIKQVDWRYATSSPRDQCMNIAFTAQGLKALGVPVDEENGFSRAFIEGMDTEHRNRILGDFGANASTDWEWGNKQHDQLHLVLMVFTRDQAALDNWDAVQSATLAGAGLETCSDPIDSIRLPDGKEHFGFKDGISQPVIRGLGRQSSEDNYVNAGEFILGYENDYGKEPHSPRIQKGEMDFGKNGSYMVFRQLEQHVPLFWNTVCDHFGGKNEGREKGIELAAKMVGRWLNGNPLTEAPDKKIKSGDMNRFSFFLDDPNGTQCPLGSHIRRSNPRDSLSSNSKSSSLRSATDAANKHRILRRGRPYGKPVDEGMAIDQILDKIDGDQESRGLNFICFNTDIDRQFEFVQQTWSNNIKFHNLYNDVDPIMGVQNGGRDEAGHYQMAPTQFEVQASPVRKRYQDVPPFVKVRGGSYFFLPGRQALEYLSKSPD